LPARPLRASPAPPVGSVSSLRHPWDFALQRSDCVLSRTPFGWPCPSFPWLVASPCRLPEALRRTGRLTGQLIGFQADCAGMSHVPGFRLAPSFCKDGVRRHLDGSSFAGCRAMPGCPGRLSETRRFPRSCPIRRVAARQLALATATSVHARLPRSSCCHALRSSLRVLESKGSSPERACFSAMVFRPSTGPHTSLGCSRPPGIDRSDLAAGFAAAPLSLLPYRAGRCWSLRVSIGRPARRSATLRYRPLLALGLFSLLSRPPYSSNLAALEHERSWLSGHW